MNWTGILPRLGDQPLRSIRDDGRTWLPRGIAADWFGVRVVARMTAKTVTEYDDMIVEACRPAVRPCPADGALLHRKTERAIPAGCVVLQGILSSWAILI